jgi:hypothetical protein
VRRAAAVLFAGALAAQAPVFVVGEAAATTVPCAAYENLLGAIGKADPKPDAALDSVVLLRLRERDSLAVVVDVGAMVRTGRGARNLQLMPGDVIYVPPRHAAAPRPTPDELVDAARRALLASAIADERRAWLQRDMLVHTGDRVARHQAALDLAHSSERELAVRLLVSALDCDASIAREAATALGTMGAAAKAALPVLERLRDHRDADLRARVAAAIRQIEAVVKSPR